MTRGQRIGDPLASVRDPGLSVFIRVYPCSSVALLRGGRGLLDRRLGGGGRLGEAREGGRRRDGELRQALAIERAAGGLQAGHELAVAEAVLARGGVDPLDPQPAEVA